MTVWLYQMNANKKLEYGGKFTPKDFQKHLKKNEYLEWKTRNIVSGKQKPAIGDTVIYWFVKTGTDNPGLYGLGVILKFYENNDGSSDENWISHLPVFPNSKLKEWPLYNHDLERTVNEIRDGKQKFGTMFVIEDKQAQKIFENIWSELDLNQLD